MLACLLNALQPSEAEITTAFSAGDNDHDDGLSLGETAEALEKLCGKSVDQKDIEEAAESVGVGFEGREIDGEFECVFFLS